MEYVTRRGILLVGNFILQFIIYLKVKYPQHLKVDENNIDGKITRKAVNGFCTYNMKSIFELIGWSSQQDN